MQGMCNIYRKTEPFHNFSEIFLSVKPQLVADTLQQDSECRRTSSLLCAAPHLFIVEESHNANTFTVPFSDGIHTGLD